MMEKSCCAVILAGGESRRMGRNKAALRIGEESFIERIARELEGFREKYVSVGSGAAVLPGWEPLGDIFPGCGPMGGIHAALSSCGAEWAVFVPCDAPLYRRAIAELLWRAAVDDASAAEGPGDDSGRQIIVPVTADGRWHMTAGLYRKSLLPDIEKCLKEGNYRLRNLVRENNTGTVLLDGTYAAYGEMLTNVNTEEEYRALLGRLGGPVACLSQQGGLQ